MSIAEKLNIANDKVPKVYDAGESKAHNKPYIDTLKITNFNGFFSNERIPLELVNYVDTSNGVSFNSMFMTCTSITTIPKLDTGKSTDFSNMFDACWELITIPTLDTSNGVYFNSMFSSCSALTNVPYLDTSNGVYFDNMFDGCNSLITITNLNVTKAFRLSSTFSYCSSLENITFTGSIKKTISFSNSSKLTVESIRSIINALSVYSGTSQPTLTLNSASWTAIEAVTPPDGYSTWKEYITNYKNWKYA